jgi:hypothetical protein
MRQKLYLSALVAASLIGASCSALAQNAGAAAGAQVAPGMDGVPPVGTAPPSAGTTTTTSQPARRAQHVDAGHHRHRRFAEWPAGR